MSRERLYIGPSRSMPEAIDARSLAIKVFGAISDNNADATTRFKTRVWNDHVGLDPKTVMVVALDNGEIVGTCRVLPRLMHRAGEPLAAAGISSVCLAEESRGQGISRPLLERALIAAKDFGSVIAFLDARRAYDHYYTKFDFHGLSVYPKISMKVSDLPLGQGIRFETTQPTEFDTLNAYYESCYRDCFGRLQRSPSAWRAISEHLDFLGAPIRTLCRLGRTCGYLIENDGCIEEIAFDPDIRPFELFGAVARLLGIGQTLVMNITPTHLGFRAIADARADVALSWRQCPYGGHMIRVVDRDKLCGVVAQRAGLQARALGLGSYEERQDALVLRWDGTKMTASLDAESDSPLGFETTRALLGASLPFASPTILDLALPLHIGLPDRV
jgi:GNAT superfamily N-acetyltransferase